jgi:hypothetical protein
MLASGLSWAPAAAALCISARPRQLGRARGTEAARRDRRCAMNFFPRAHAAPPLPVPRPHRRKARAAQIREDGASQQHLGARAVVCCRAAERGKRNERVRLPAAIATHGRAQRPHAHSSRAAAAATPIARACSVTLVCRVAARWPGARLAREFAATARSHRTRPLKAAGCPSQGSSAALVVRTHVQRRISTLLGAVHERKRDAPAAPRWPKGRSKAQTGQSKPLRGAGGGGAATATRASFCFLRGAPQTRRSEGSRAAIGR